MVARTEPVDPPLTELVDLLRRYKRGEGIEQTPFPSFGQTSQRSAEPIGEARFALASGEQMILPGAAPAGAHSGQADIVDWLVPTPEEADLPVHTFRDSCLVLSVLEVSEIVFPLQADADHAWIYVRPAARTDMTIRTGSIPSFFEGPYEDVAFVLYLDSWHCFNRAPDIASSEKAFRYSFLARLPEIGPPVRQFELPP